jgi:hypothetical protein
MPPVSRDTPSPGNFGRLPPTWVLFLLPRVCLGLSLRLVLLVLLARAETWMLLLCRAILLLVFGDLFDLMCRAANRLAKRSGGLFDSIRRWATCLAIARSFHGGVLRRSASCLSSQAFSPGCWSRAADRHLVNTPIGSRWDEGLADRASRRRRVRPRNRPLSDTSRPHRREFGRFCRDVAPGIRASLAHGRPPGYRATGTSRVCDRAARVPRRLLPPGG